jgi:GTP-binding protein EngB required for normal cell division
MNLSEYDRTKMELAELLRGATMRSLPKQAEATVRDLFARLADDRFNLVVVGRFSRGKSTLMNAMMGSDWLPTGIVPVTSVITTVIYGSVPQVALYYQHTNLFLEIPITQLADHITERGNPGNRRRIRTAEVQLPAELLRRGFYFIDTPGLGSSIIENTRTTESFLPEADAFVLVTSFDSPLSEEEERVLRVVRDSGRRAFVLVNKQDTVNPTQQQDVLEHISLQLSRIFGNTPPPLFSVSAQQALEARCAGDEVRLGASGVLAFEAALIDFLLHEKRREFLLGMCTRIDALIECQPGADHDREKLAVLRTEVEASRPEAPEPKSPPLPAMPISAAVAACEVCAGINEAIFDFTAKYQYHLYGERQTQAELSERRGLCGPHSTYFEPIASPTGVCTAMAPVVQRQAGYLRALAREEPNGATAREVVEAALPTRETCPICEIAQRAAETITDKIAARLNADAAGGLRELSAICLPHLVLLLGKMEDRHAIRLLLSRQADVLERFSEDMRHFAMKRDGLMRHLITKEEETAGQRGLRVLTGHPRAQLGPTGRVTRKNVTPMARRTGFA